MKDVTKIGKVQYQ